MEFNTLTEQVKEFILGHFFFNSKYAGWRNIAEKLLEEKSCIVAGNDCIWIGGVGNFIKLNKAEEYFGCVEYKFDYNSFIKSAQFQNVIREYLSETVEKIVELNNTKKDLEELIVPPLN